MKLFPTRRTVKRWGIGLVIVLGVLLMINGIMSWRTEARFQRLVENIRAEGDPASIAELKPLPIPDEQNAAAQIDKLSPRLDEFSKEYGQFYKTDLGKALDEQNSGGRPNAEQIAAMRSILEEYSDLEQMIADAADSTQFASTGDFTLGFRDFLETELPRMSRIRDIARFVDWGVQVLIADGRREEAINRALALLRLSELNESQPTIVSFLITVAVRNMALQDIYQALAAGPISAETHEELDHALRALEDHRSLAGALRTERALSISASVEQGWEQMPPTLGRLVGWPVKRHFIGAIEYYDRLIPVADRHLHELKPLFAKGGKLVAPTGLGVMADVLVPALQAAFKAASRNAAFTRSLCVYNALQLSEAGDGRPVNGLTDLDLPSEATIDPFSGKPLVVKRTDDGWNVYSVGDNEADDGGNFEHSKDYGFGPGKQDD